MNLDFLRDPEWPSLNPEVKKAAFDIAFEDEVMSDPEWKTLDPKVQAEARKIFLEDVAAEEQKIAFENAPEKRSLAGSLASGAARGVVNVVGKAGQILELADRTPREADKEEGIFDTAGRGIVDWSKKVQQEYDFLKQDKSELAGEQGFVRRGVVGIAENIPQSLPIMATAFGGAKAGAAIAAPFGAAGGPAGMAAAAGTGAVIGGITGAIAGLVAFFGAGTYGEEYTSAYEELAKTRPESTEEERQEVAHRVAFKSAAFEVGTEIPGTLLGLRMVGGTKVLTQPLIATLRNVSTKPTAQFAKEFGVAAAGEVGGEMIAAAGQAQARIEEGLSGPTIPEAVAESIIPSIGMSLFFGGAAAGYNSVQTRSMMKKLNSDNIKERQDAVDIMTYRLSENTQDKALALSWRNEAEKTIQAGEKFNFDEKVIDFAKIKAAEGFKEPESPLLYPEDYERINQAKDLKEALTEFNRIVVAPEKTAEDITIETLKRIRETKDEGLTLNEAAKLDPVSAQRIYTEEKMDLFPGKQVEYTSPKGIFQRVILTEEKEGGRWKARTLDDNTEIDVVPHRVSLVDPLEPGRQISYPTKNGTDSIVGVLVKQKNKDQWEARQLGNDRPFTANVEKITPIPLEGEKFTREEPVKPEEAAQGPVVEPVAAPVVNRADANREAFYNKARASGIPEDRIQKLKDEQAKIEGNIGAAVPGEAEIVFEQGVGKINKRTGYAITPEGLEIQRKQDLADNDSLTEKLISETPEATPDQIKNLKASAEAYKAETNALYDAKIKELSGEKKTEGKPSTDAEKSFVQRLEAGQDSLSEEEFDKLDSAFTEELHKRDKNLDWRFTGEKGSFKVEIFNSHDLRQSKISSPGSLINVHESELGDFQYEEGNEFILINWSNRHVPVKVVSAKDGKISEAVDVEYGKTGRVVIRDGRALSTKEVLDEKEWVAPKKTGVKAQIDTQAHEAAASPQNDLTEPTPDQARAGNYKKAHLKGDLVNLSGMDITIENPEGSTRSEAKPKDAPDDWEPNWSQTMKNAHYGYFKRTEGKDGDQIDVFIGPKPEAKTAYIIDQINPETGNFDEHKTMVGYGSKEEAQEAYLSNYEKGWKGLGAITEMPVDQFKEWVSDGKRKTEPVAYGKTEPVEAAPIEWKTEKVAGMTKATTPLEGDMLIIKQHPPDKQKNQFTVYKESDGPKMNIGKTATLEEAKALAETIIPKIQASARAVQTEGTNEQFKQLQGVWKKEAQEGKITTEELGRRIVGFKVTEASRAQGAQNSGISKILQDLDSTDLQMSDAVAQLKDMEISDPLKVAIADYERAVKVDKAEYGMRSGLPEQAEQNLRAVMEKEAAPQASARTEATAPQSQALVPAAPGASAQSIQAPRKAIFNKFRKAITEHNDKLEKKVSLPRQYYEQAKAKIGGMFVNKPVKQEGVKYGLNDWQKPFNEVKDKTIYRKALNQGLPVSRETIEAAGLQDHPVVKLNEDLANKRISNVEHHAAVQALKAARYHGADVEIQFDFESSMDERGTMPLVLDIRTDESSGTKYLKDTLHWTDERIKNARANGTEIRIRGEYLDKGFARRALPDYRRGLPDRGIIRYYVGARPYEIFHELFHHLEKEGKVRAGKVDESEVRATKFGQDAEKAWERGGLKGFIEEVIKEENREQGRTSGETEDIEFPGEGTGTFAAGATIGRVRGDHISTPQRTYPEASKGKGNPWIRASDSPTNEDRTLLVQFTSKLMGEPKTDLSTEYYDSLYSGTRKGYDRLPDFWETPQWIAMAAKTVPNSDVYVVRDMKEAKKFVKESGYKNVAFSSLDVTRDLIKELAPSFPGEVIIGGYADPKAFKDLKHTWFNSIEEMAKAQGAEYTQGSDYRHFKGSKVIPRLTMSQGCKYKCAFCTVPKKLDVSSKEFIDQQVESFKDLDAKLIYLNDKTFGQAGNYQYLSELNKRIKGQNPNFEGFIIQTTASDLNRMPTEWLKESGIKYVELGVESYNDFILKGLHKPHNTRIIDQATNKLRDLKINLVPNIIIGIPEETDETYDNTFDYLKRNEDIISHANIYNLAIYEGTELESKIGAKTAEDQDENVAVKSFHKDQKIHDKFAEQIFNLMKDRLSAPAAYSTRGELLPGQEKWFGDKIKKSFKTNEVMSLLLDSPAQSGPFDGGCLIVAKALKRIEPDGKIITIESKVEDGWQAEHYGLKLNGGVIDADGYAKSPEEWAKRFTKNELLKSPYRVTESLVPGEATDDPPTEKKLAEVLLKDIAGDYSIRPEIKSIISDAKKNGTYLKAPNGADTLLDKDLWATVRTANFKNWFGDWEKGNIWGRDDVSKVVDVNGEPLVVYHGTQKGGFTVFEPLKRDSHETPSTFFTDARGMAATYSGSRRDIGLPSPKTRKDLEDMGWTFNKEDGNVYAYYNDDEVIEGKNISDAVSQAIKYPIPAGEERGVYPVFLNIRNPLEEDFEGANWDGSRDGQYMVLNEENDPQDINGKFYVTREEAEAYAEENGGEVEPAWDMGETTNSVAREGKKYGNDGAIIRNVTDSGGKLDHYEPADVFVIFNSNQAKSTENTGEFNPKEEDIRFSVRDDYNPKSTVKAYKLFKVKKKTPGNLYPLFIGKDKDTPIGKWLVAENIPTKGFDKRPGWHVGSSPYAPHLMHKDGTMFENRVWAEVEIPNDVDWQKEADQSPTKDVKNKVPAGGFYRFKRPLNQGGEWKIAGAIKINRVLSEEDVEDILAKEGQFSVDGVPKELKGKKVKLTHWSNVKGLKKTDPKYFGTGSAGAERMRYGEFYTPVTFFGVPPYKQEAWVTGAITYIAEVDGDKLYDIQNDPLNLWPTEKQLKRFDVAPYDKRTRVNLYERNIKNKGFDGYFAREHNVVAMFKPVPVKPSEPTNEALYSAAAWHGSPFTFDKFSKDKIGTGEGAQAYGYGLYFAGKKEVAEYYKNVLSKSVSEQPTQIKWVSYADDMSEFQQYEFTLYGKNGKELGSWYKSDSDELEKIIGEENAQIIYTKEENGIFDGYLDNPAEIPLKQGRLYQVELAPDEDEYLLWDKPLNEQSEKVKAALSPYNILGRFKDKEMYGDVSDTTTTGRDLYKMVELIFWDNNRRVNEKPGERAAKYLHSLGIRGIKYLDGTSRGKGEGDYNYVIFSDEDVEIKERFSVRTPEFKAWFGDSKVVDENGKPLVVYHGTIADFDSFSTRRDKSKNRIGAYFTSDAKAASRIHGGVDSVYPVYLAMSNPFDLRETTREDIAKSLGLNEGIQREMQIQGRAGAYQTLEWLDQKYDIVPKLKKKGYDGIIFDGEHEGDTYVAFSPTQIKSVYNKGTWDAENPDIRYSVRLTNKRSLGARILAGMEKPPLKVGPLVAQIADYLSTQSAKEGVIDHRTAGPKENKQVEKALVDMIEASIMKHPESIGWYRGDIQRTMSILEEIYPDLKKPSDNFWMRLAIALTSDGNKTMKNVELADIAYRARKSTGSLVTPINAKRGNAIMENLRFAEAVRKTFKSDKEFEKWLLGKAPVREIASDLSEKLGLTREEAATILSGENLDSVVPRAVIFGPKVGAFFANLSGDFSPVTMDMWFMRTMGRIQGNLMEGGSPGEVAQERDRLRKAIESSPQGMRFVNREPSLFGLDDAELDEIAKDISKKSIDETFRNRLSSLKGGNELRLAANARERHLKGGTPIDAPSSGAHRKWLRDRVNAAREALNSKYENADIQATIWIGEKEIYNAFGSRPTKGDYFSDGANALYEKLHGRPPELYAGAAGQVARSGRPSDTQGALFSARENVSEFLDVIRDNPDGFTINVTDGTLETSGWVVAPSKLTETYVDTLTEDEVRNFLYRFRVVFENDDRAFLGGWFNKERGQFALDVAYKVEDKETATYLAELGEQDAIFHLDDYTEHKTRDAVREIRESGVYSESKRDALRGVRERLDKIIQGEGTDQRLSAREPVVFQDTLKPVTDEDFLENRRIMAEGRKIFGPAAKEAKKDILSEVSRLLAPISTRARYISPEIAERLRNLDRKTNTSINDYANMVIPLLKKARKMNREDSYDWDFARKNSNTEKINYLVKKYDMQEEYAQAREMFDKLREEAIDVGLDIGEIEEYWTRIVKDLPGLYAEMNREERGVFTKALEEKAASLGLSVEELDPDMRATIVTNVIFGGPSGPGGAKLTKQRSFRQVPPRLNKYYMHSDEAAMHHIQAMVTAIEKRKFFGKIPERVAETRRQLYAAQAKVREWEDRVVKAATKTEANKAKWKLQQWDGEVRLLEGQIFLYAHQRDYKDNIGAFIDEFISKNDISPEHENELKEILEARFHERGTHGFWSLYKNFSYMDTMGSVVSALTQIGDVAWAMYEAGIIKGLKHAGRAAVGKSIIKREDVGITTASEEFMDPSKLGGAVQWVFKWTGLTKMDAIGKEALLNATLEKHQIEARKNPEALAKKIRHIFGEETQETIQALQDGEITDNVKMLVYSRLADFQPVGLSEMPQRYLTSGNGRVFYMLKTFTIKQFDAFRNEAIHKITHGDRAEKIQGLKNLIRLAMFFVLANATADELKDLILGRKTDFSDRVADNILRLAGSSKFITWTARTEGIGSAFAKQILPPFKFIDSLSKDVIKAGDDKGLEVVASIPLIGKLAYWHLGRGTSKRKDIWDIRWAKHKSEFTEVHEKYEKAQNKEQFLREHKDEIVEYHRMNRVQGRLNSFRKIINQLKSRPDQTDSIKKRIEQLETRRTEMIKTYLERSTE